MRMDVEFIKIGTKVTSEIITEHAGEVLRWNGDPFSRRNLQESVDVLKLINDYWEQRPAAQQQQIFFIYQRVYEAMNTVPDVTQLIMVLRPLVKELYEIMTLESMQLYYAFNKTNLYIPPTMEETFKPAESFINTREKTYLRSDYINLALLVMLLRPMIPIWGEFIDRHKDACSINLKEYYAFQVLATSSVLLTPGVAKLTEYVSSLIPKGSNKISNAVAVDGLGSEELLNNLVGSALVARVCVGDLYASVNHEDNDEPNTRFHLVIAVYKYINSKIASINQTGGAAIDSVVRSKKQVKESDGHDEQSVLEGFKTKQAHAMGAYLPYVIYAENTQAFINAIDPKLSHSFYLHLLASANRMNSELPEEGQLAVMHWITGEVIPPSAESYLNSLQLRNSLVAAQAWLWQNGHKRLAALMTATAARSSSDIMLTGGGALQKIPQDVQEQLGKLYPYQRFGKARQRTRPTPPIIEAIYRVANMLNSNDWLIKLPDELAVEIVGKGASMRYACPSDIRVLLSNVILQRFAV